MKLKTKGMQPTQNKKDAQKLITKNEQTFTNDNLLYNYGAQKDLDENAKQQGEIKINAQQKEYNQKQIHN